MDPGYVVIPFVAWFLAGSTKFVINSIKAGKPAFGQIGYGGLPSNHAAIVSSAAALVTMREGIDHPAVAVAMALALVVIFDATSLRRQIGRHAEAINRLDRRPGQTSLRERMGHTALEIGAGVGVGIFAAWLVDQCVGRVS